jgi:hypothetical protein
MASFNKFNQFVEDLARGVHNLNTGTLKVALTNTAPVATNATLSQITQISGGNGYTTGGETVGNSGASQTSGTLALVGDDVVFTATGAVGPFRYAVLYNDTPTSPADPLIGWWDYGSSISLANGETFTVDFGATILTVA